MSKNYFFSAAEAVEKIISEGIENCPMEIGGNDGIVVADSELEGFSVSAGDETEIPGIFLADLDLSAKVEVEKEEVDLSQFSVKVVYGNWDGGNSEDFANIAKKKLLPVVQKNIILSVPHNKFRKPEEEGTRFHIFIWSSANPDAGMVARKDVPEKIWNIPVACRDSFMPVSGTGISISDGDYIVAELVGDNLYIHHDICHKGTQSELDIFSRLLDEVIVELTLDPEEKARRKARQLAEVAIANRNGYISECNRRFEKTVKGTKKKIEDGLAEIDRLQRELTRRIRETNGAKRKLVQLESCKDGETEKYGQEYDALLQVPGVEEVHVADGVIKVFTEHVYITPDGHSETYDIGKFRMEIYTSGANGGIRFFNITRQGKGGGYNTNHPHVQRNGAPCLGNISEMVPALIGEYEYSAVAQLGLQYLKSVNLDDSAGVGILEYWPLKEEKK